MPRTARTRVLTALAVKRYAEGPPTKKELHDGGGLYLRRREGGAYWYLRMSDPSTGATQWHRMFPEDPLGAFPHKSLADARSEAERLWQVRSQGLDPRAERLRLIEEKRQQEQAAQLLAERRLSVRQLFDRWRETELQPRIRADGKRTGRKDGGQYVLEQFTRHVFPRIGDMTLENLRKTDLLGILDAQVSAGKLRTANVLLADLKQMLDFALERELIVANPLATVRKGKIGGAAVERDRVLSENEIIQLVAQLPEARLHLRSHAAVWLILSTGVRVGELMGAVWAEDLPTDPRKRAARIDALAIEAETADVKLGIVNPTGREWYLPQTKNQRDHRIHLSDFALAQFRLLAGLRESLKDTNDGTLSPWVFPATDNRMPVCVKSFGKQLSDRQRPAEERLSNRTKATTTLILPGGKWTAHDLRRTAATLMARRGFGSDVINECLNHVQKDRMAKVYIRDRREAEQIKAFDALGETLAALIARAKLG